MIDRDVARQFLEGRGRRAMLRIGGHEEDVDRLEDLLAQVRLDERLKALKEAAEAIMELAK